MILRRLTLRNFRSYDFLDLSFDCGTTIITGDNATGKTNLVEAINYLSLIRSWRSGDDAPLIKEGAETAVISADLQEGAISRRIEVEIASDHKKVFLNGKAVRQFSKISRLTNILLFSPASVPFFLQGPGERREFLDVSLSKQSQDYLTLLSKYTSLLKQRNVALKEKNPDLNLLEVLSDQMSEIALPIVVYRSMYAGRLNQTVPGLFEELTGRKDACRLRYKPFARPDEQFLGKVKKLYHESLEGDLKRGFTSVGPHREDLRMELGGRDIAEFGSQGENRLAVLALKLSPYFLVEDQDKKPICVLDDATSELDDEKVARLFAVLKKMGQVFVTTTKLEIPGTSHIDVSRGIAARR